MELTPRAPMLTLSVCYGPEPNPTHPQVAPCAQQEWISEDAVFECPRLSVFSSQSGNTLK